jgi:F-type H+-transporting ATPase subunit epsilon
MPITTKLEIATPEGVAYSSDVESITLPGVEGQLSLLPQHVKFMTQLVPGEMIIRKDGKDDFLAVGGGLVEATNERVSVLTTMAINSADIDEAAVEQARKRAAARLGEKISAEEVAATNAALARSLAQLHVKRRHR